MEKVSVIIPSYNRFKYLLNAIKSIKNQTYKNIEIIVINDCSDEKKYYDYDWEKEGIIIIHLKYRSKEKFGYPCVGYVRNTGIKKASGKYIAFCDDDDIWFPKKLELQIIAMKESGCKMSSTDGLIGSGPYDEKKKYTIYNAKQHYNTIKKIFKNKKSNLMDNGYPKIWTLKFLKIHNCMICSSVIIEKEILDKIKGMPYNRRGQDYRCWLKALKLTNSIYLNDICFYYDRCHGNGQNH